MPEGQTGGMTIVATTSSLLETLNLGMADGVFLGGASNEYPAVVLGAVAAERLGIEEVGTGTLIWMADTWVEVIGILEPFHWRQISIARCSSACRWRSTTSTAMAFPPPFI